MPDTVSFATKAVLARWTLERAFAAGMLARWGTADEAYGQDHKFRAWLEDRCVGLVRLTLGEVRRLLAHLITQAFNKDRLYRYRDKKSHYQRKRT